MSEDKELTLYELSIHLIPSLSSEEAQAAHEKMVAQIEGDGGSVKMNQLPVDYELSYEMCKEIAGKKHYYKNAHFGFVVFEGDKEKAVALDKSLKESKIVLRHLFIKLPKEALIKRERKIPTSHREDVKKVEEKKADEPIDEVAIDKTIDELVVE
jgi:ribosomal protein S6